MLYGIILGIVWGIIAVYRPEFTHTWGGKSYYTQKRGKEYNPIQIRGKSLLCRGSDTDAYRCRHPDKRGSGLESDKSRSWLNDTWSQELRQKHLPKSYSSTILMS